MPKSPSLVILVGPPEKKPLGPTTCYKTSAKFIDDFILHKLKAAARIRKEVYPVSEFIRYALDNRKITKANLDTIIGPFEIRVHFRWSDELIHVDPKKLYALRVLKEQSELRMHNFKLEADRFLAHKPRNSILDN